MDTFVHYNVEASDHLKIRAIASVFIQTVEQKRRWQSGEFFLLQAEERWREITDAKRWWCGVFKRDCDSPVNKSYIIQIINFSQYATLYASCLSRLFHPALRPSCCSPLIIIRSFFLSMTHPQKVNQWRPCLPSLRARQVFFGCGFRGGLHGTTRGQLHWDLHQVSHAKKLSHSLVWLLAVTCPHPSLGVHYIKCSALSILPSPGRVPYSSSAWLDEPRRAALLSSPTHMN